MSSSDNTQAYDRMSLETYVEVQTWASRHPRFLWTLCASASLLSSRYLLVESNFHYPTLVYLAQLFVATAVVIFHTPCQEPRHERKYSRPRKSATHTGTLMVFGSMCFTALSMLCIWQAILHFSNLPTLAMLMTVAIFTDDLLHLVFGYTPRSREEALRIVVLLLACIGILATEYRLSVPGLITSIPAMLFTGIASALSKFAFRFHREDLPGTSKQMQFLVCIGFIVSTIWALLFWPSEKAITFDPEHIPLLIVSCAATTMATLLGASILLPTSEHFVDEKTKRDGASPYMSNAWHLLAVVGITGCYSSLSARGSYVSWYQLSCFALALGCIAHKATQDTETKTTQHHHNQSDTYALLNDLPPTEREAEEAGKATCIPGAIRSIRSTLDGWASRSQNIHLGVGMLSMWVFYLWLNFHTPEHTQDFTLDTNYEPALPLELVISMYKEPVKDVKELVTSVKTNPETLSLYVTIYIKDEKADTDEVQRRTGADRVIKRPNVGREGETYLYHINDRWDSLAKHTIFLQADIHNPREFYPRLRNYFDSKRTGFLSLGWSDVCSCEGCGDRFAWSDDTGIFPHYHSKIYSSADCSNVLLSYKGQFIVSAARIRGINKMIYNDLWHDFVDEKSWAHQPEFLKGRPDSMSAPDFGYTMERMWNLLFQCSDMSVAARCPTLLSGWRLGGDVEDCQCFD